MFHHISMCYNAITHASASMQTQTWTIGFRNNPANLLVPVVRLQTWLGFCVTYYSNTHSNDVLMHINRCVCLCFILFIKCRLRMIYEGAVQSRYNAVNFPPNHNKRYPIALARGGGGYSNPETLMYIIPQPLQWCMQFHVLSHAWCWLSLLFG